MNPASSAVRYTESIRLQMESMMRVGDIADCSRTHRGKPREEHRAEIEEETQIAIDLIRRGQSMTQAGAFIGISGGALQRRLNVRGLTVTKIREEQK